MTNPLIRVFVSSTFRDFQEERRMLATHVWPQLRRLCREHGVEFVEVDLRWGITEEQARDGETLRFCLDEIRSSRPFFVGLLGERYGWVPDAQVFTPDLLEDEPWLERFRDSSVTELEFRHGVLNAPEAAQLSRIYLRDPAFGSGNADFQAENEAAAARQSALKAEVREAAARYGLVIRQSLAGPQAIADQILADLTALIQARFPLDEGAGQTDRELADHAAFAQSRRRFYLPREGIHQRLNEFARSDIVTPLVVTGDSGSGKSALLANWVGEYRAVHPDDFVFEHYVGGTPASNSHADVVRRLSHAAKAWLGDPAGVATRYEDLLSELSGWLAKLSAVAGSRGVRCVIVIDALNQLLNQDLAHRLNWLPPEPWNQPIRLVLSTLPGESLRVAAERGWEIFEMTPLREEEREALIDGYLSRFGKALAPARRASIAAAPAAGNPLFLRAMLDDLRVTGLHDTLDQQLNGYLACADLPALHQAILARLERDYEVARPNLVGEALSLIWAAAEGLTEAELRDLLGIPAATWSPLRYALEDSLLERRGVLTFGHDYLRRSVQRRFVFGDAAARELRLRLADFFEGRDLDARQAAELPWLLHEIGEGDRLAKCLSSISRFNLFSRDRYPKIWEWWLASGHAASAGQAYLEAFPSWAEQSGLQPLAVAEVCGKLGFFLDQAGLRESSLEFYTRGLELRQSEFGDAHVETLKSMQQVGSALSKQGKFAEADKWLREALVLSEAHQAPDFIGTQYLLETLGLLYRDWGKLDHAREMLERCLASRLRSPGKLDPQTLWTESALAGVMAALNPNDSEPWLRAIFEKQEQVLGADHPHTNSSRLNLASILSEIGRHEEALDLITKTTEIEKRTLGEAHPTYLDGLQFLSGVLMEMERFEDAIACLRHAVQVYEAPGREMDSRALLYVLNLVWALYQGQRKEEALALLRQRVLSKADQLHQASQWLLESLEDLVFHLDEDGCVAEAGELFELIYAVNRQFFGADAVTTLRSLSNYAIWQDEQGHGKEALPLYRQVAEGYERALGPDHTDTIEAKENLVLAEEEQGVWIRRPFWKRWFW